MVLLDQSTGMARPDTSKLLALFQKAAPPTGNSMIRNVSKVGRGVPSLNTSTRNPTIPSPVARPSSASATSISG